VTARRELIKRAIATSSFISHVCRGAEGAMQATFFATDEDLLEVAGWFLAIPGMTLFEPASRPDLPNRQFKSVDDIAQVFEEPGRNFAAWLEHTGARPASRYIEFNQDMQRKLKAKGRTELRSPSTIGIGRNNEQRGCLANSIISCWNEKGARQRSMYDTAVLHQVDWKLLRSTLGGLQRKLAKAAPAKLGAHPIMGTAFARMQAGELELWNWGSPCSFPSPLVTLT
jgi:hypothetical protein